MMSEGLLLLTNNGKLARYLEHPSQGFQRKYRVRIRGTVLLLLLLLSVVVDHCLLVQYILMLVFFSRCEQLNENVIKRLAEGVRVDKIQYEPITVTPTAQRDRSENSTNQWINVTLTQGRNREIRKVFEHFNLVVTRIVRTRFG